MRDNMYKFLHLGYIKCKLFPLFYCNNAKTKKRYIYILLNTFFNIWLIVWVAFYASSQLIHKKQYKEISGIMVDERLLALVPENDIEKIVNSLKKSQISFHSMPKINVYQNDFFYFFNLFPGTQTIAIDTVAYGVGSTISLRESYVYKGKYFLDDQRHFSEDISFLLTHELVHAWESERYGFIQSFVVTSVWVKEGYATYIAKQEDSLFKMIVDKLQIKNDITEFVKYYMKHNSDIVKHSPADYLFYSLMVKHAIEKMHKSVDDLHLGKVDYDEVLNSLLREYNVTKGAK